MSDSIARVVFDCNIFVQALLNPKGVSGSCKNLVDDGKVILFISKNILTEIIEVVNRPQIRRLAPSLTSEQIEIFLEGIKANAISIKNVPEKFKYERDPTDEPYINLAIVADADYLISRDRDLLDLMTRHTAEGKEFRQRFRPLKVLDPIEFLKTLTTSD